ncbi:MAG: glutamate-cysteine ligase family protein [Longimicrobiales bacterium]|nr:glutamate-cysteine ligase family protein [Longimicrobiales bacterium]
MKAERFAAVVREAFTPVNPDAPPSIGVEAEFLVIDLERRVPVPPRGPSSRFDARSPTSIPILEEMADRCGWERIESAGLPRYRRSDGTVIAFEPGGQLEFATPPLPSLDAVDHAIREGVDQVAEVMGLHGVGLLARGLDPWTPVTVPDLHLRLPRYERMAAHYDRRGTDGRRMMRQTAGVHVNLDLGHDPIGRWERANAIVPDLISIFANSCRIEGRPGWRSERSRTWRRLDPSRTGVFASRPDPVGEYLRFARRAEAFLVAEPETSAVPWGMRDAELGIEAWRDHLSTLFPEVRPRRYLELRSIDALPPDQVVLAAGYAAGIVYRTGPEYGDAGPGAGWVDARPGGRVDLALLERAGDPGLADPQIHARALEGWRRADEGLDRLGSVFASSGIRDRIREFRDTLTSRARDPGALEGDWVHTRSTPSRV